MKSQIQIAAETVACSHADRCGLSCSDEQDRQCILDAVAAAFADDPQEAQEAAQAFAEAWLDEVAAVES